MNAFNELRNELDRRINPERSRKFSHEQFLKSRENLAKLGREEWLSSDALRISVVGSNGKGSTAWSLAALLGEITRKSVGLYTSPHLLTPLERIRLNLKEIPEEEALSVFREVESHGGSVARELSYFEMLTVMAIRYFHNRSCTYEIYEAGLGGRLDATRMAGASIVVLTGISKEHTELLGNRTEEILIEKLGIITKKTDRLFILLRKNGLLTEGMVQDVLQKMEGESRISGIQTHFYEGYREEGGRPVNYLEENLNFARFILESIVAEDDSSDSQSARIFSSQIPLPPGRLESHRINLPSKNSAQGRRIHIIFDTAHNAEGLEVTLQSLKNIDLSPEKTLVVTASLPDRDADSFINILFSYGFPNVVSLQKEGFGFSTLKNVGRIRWTNEGNPEGYDADQSTIGEIVDILVRRDMETCLFVGTHRTYSLFRALIRYGAE